LLSIARSLPLSFCAVACLFALRAQTAQTATSDSPSPAPTISSADLGGCPVTPVPPITDPVAGFFNTSESLDIAGLTSGMARALARFRQMVTSIGGSVELRSAYRPPAYQLYLQQVWDKWMALRNDREPGCQDLREQVGQEFARHHLIETQRPVSSSDHTRGLAFDATVLLPRNARIRRRRVTLDTLARLAGLCRPDIRHDPVHFKFVGRATRA
jgi:hypothetical protein